MSAIRSVLPCLAGLAASISAATPLDPYTWRNVFIGGGGFVPGIVFHPKAKGIAYARTDMGGAYRWNPDSCTWTPITDMFDRNDWNRYGIESIGLDPQDPDIVYIASGTYAEHNWSGNGAILRSRDRGNTWKVVDMPLKFGGNENGRSAGERLAVDPNNGSILFCGTRLNGLWKSADSGKTWNQVPSFPVVNTSTTDGLGFVVFDPRSGSIGQATKTIYVGVEDNGNSLYRSLDAGATWSPVPGAPGGGMMPHHGVLASDGWMYFTYANGDGPGDMTKGQVWKYNTANGTWVNISPVANATFGFAGLDVDAQHPGTVMVSSMDLWWPGDNEWRSTDGGATWKDLNSNSNRDASLTPFLHFGRPATEVMQAGNWQGGLSIDPFDSDHVMYGTGATIWGTKNVTAMDAGGKVDWTPHIKGLEENGVAELASPPTGPELISAMGDIGGFVHSDIDVSPAGGMLNPFFRSQTSVDFAEAKPSTMLRVGAGCDAAFGACGALSTDGGTTWKTFGSAPGNSREYGVAALSTDGSTIVWSPSGAGAYVSTDVGATWTACAGLSGTDVMLVSDRVNPRRFYSIVGGTLYASNDGAKTFSAKASNLSGNYLRAVPGLEGNIWLAGGNGLYRSTDGGASFAKISTSDWVSHVGFGKAAPGASHPAVYANGYVGTAIGIYRSDDAGANWVRVNDDLHQWGGTSVVIGDPKIYGRFYLAANGRGILVGDKLKSTEVTAMPRSAAAWTRRGDLLIGSAGPVALVDLSGRRLAVSHRTAEGAVLDLSRIPRGLYLAVSSGSPLTVTITR